MDHFVYQNGNLQCESVPAEGLAERFGTPLYVYSSATLRMHVRRMRDAFARLDPLICFSVKCLPNVQILKLLADDGLGCDVVSGGELFRALRAGVDPARIVFAGVGKTSAEIREALTAGVRLFNVESEQEMETLLQLAAEAGVVPGAALRINPDVDAGAHAYTTTGRKENKFGVDVERARAFFERYGREAAVRLTGVHVHIGSPVNDLNVHAAAIRKALTLVDELRSSGFEIDTFDVGGGFGAYYAAQEAPSADEYARELSPLLSDRGLKIIIEPGRSIAANAGVLLTRVLYTKTSGARRFVICDAAMNDLIRPALYNAYHFIWPVAAGGFAPSRRGVDVGLSGLETVDVVGPICETGDFLARERRLPPVRPGDLLAVFTVGAYGMAMSSQYNSRPRPAEVLVAGDSVRLIRRRETYADLLAAEDSGAF